MARTEPGDIKKQLPALPPDQPEPFDAIVRDLDQIIVPGLSHWQHPQFFGYFPCNGTLASVLGDYVSTGLGVLGLAWQSSPALTELEEVVTDWMRGMLGLSDGVERRDSGHRLHQHADRADVRARADHRLQREPGRAAGGAAAARRLHVGAQPQLGRQGGAARRLRPRQRPCHPARRTLRDAAGRAGRRDRRGSARRRQAVRHRRDLGQHGLDGAGSDRRHRDARRRSTSSGCTSTRRWPARRWCFPSAAGCGAASRAPTRSSINPHKWLGAAFDCTLYYVRDPQHLVRVMSTNPSYLQTAADGRVKNLRDWGIPLGRRFRALKLWFLIREQGVSGLQARLRRDLGKRALAGRARSPRRRDGTCSRRCRCRHSACATSRPAWTATRSIATRRRGAIASTDRARRT